MACSIKAKGSSEELVTLWTGETISKGKFSKISRDLRDLYHKKRAAIQDLWAKIQDPSQKISNNPMLNSLKFFEARQILVNGEIPENVQKVFCAIFYKPESFDEVTLVNPLIARLHLRNDSYIYENEYNCTVENIIALVAYSLRLFNRLVELCHRADLNVSYKDLGALQKYGLIRANGEIPLSVRNVVVSTYQIDTEGNVEIFPSPPLYSGDVDPDSKENG